MTPADLDLVRRREALHARDVPADDIPDDLLDVADGGPVMGRLPRWTTVRMREWCEVLVRHPGLAREVAAWCAARADRLADLSLVAVRAEDGWPGGLSPSVYAELARDDEDARKSSGCVISPAEVERARSPVVVLRLDEALAELERMPRPWWAMLEEAVRRARAGATPPDLIMVRLPDRRFTQATAHRIEIQAPVRAVSHRLPAKMVGRVNARPFCGADPGELLFWNVGAAHARRLTYYFALRGRSWEQDPYIDPSPFEPGNFFVLP